MPKTYRMATCCPNKRHYGKGLCKSCYRKQAKPPKKPDKSYVNKMAAARRARAIAGGVPLCKHKDRLQYRAGYCQECYEYRQDEKRGKYNSDEGLKQYLSKTYGITVEELNRTY